MTLPLLATQPFNQELHAKALSIYDVWNQILHNMGMGNLLEILAVSGMFCFKVTQGVSYQRLVC